MSVSLTIRRGVDWNLAWILTPVVLHVLSLAYFSVNHPWIDDYFWYFGFLKKLDDAGSLGAWLDVFTASYNNHWHLIQRLVIVVTTYFSGQVPLLALMWIGNLTFLRLFFLLGGDQPDEGPDRRAVWMIPMSWLFFQPVSYYNFFECAFFNLPVLLFASLSIRSFLRKDGYIFVWAVLATFSNGNGLLIWLILLMLCLRDKNAGGAVRYGIAFTLSAVLNFTFSRASAEMGVFSLSPLGDLLLYFLQTVGWIFVPGTEGAEWWFFRTLLGCAFIAVFVWVGGTLRSDEQGRWFFMLFLLGSIGLITLIRREVNGFSAQVVAHYLIFPQLLWAILIGILVGRWQPVSFLALVLYAFIAVFVISCHVYRLPVLSGHKATKIAEAVNYQESGKLRLYPFIQGEKEYLQVSSWMDYAVAKGYYRPVYIETVELSQECALKVGSNGEVTMTSSLPWRVLSRQLLFEIEEKGGSKVFFPTEPYMTQLSDWAIRKKSRSVSAFYNLHTIRPPVDTEQIQGCSVVMVK